jgi:transposase
VATSKRGLKRGLKGRKRTVILVIDSTWFTEIPPLHAVWAPIGQQAQVPIVGEHFNRVCLTTVLSLKTGDMIDYVSTEFKQGQFQDVLRLIRAHWRGWRIVLFADKHSAHTAGASQHLAKELGIELRWLPTACSELNPVDHLWRHIKKDVVANQPTPTLDETLHNARDYLISLSPRQRLRKAGVLSAEFWLADILA